MKIPVLCGMAACMLVKTYKASEKPTILSWIQVQEKQISPSTTLMMEEKSLLRNLYLRTMLHCIIFRNALIFIIVFVLQIRRLKTECSPNWITFSHRWDIVYFLFWWRSLTASGDDTCKICFLPGKCSVLPGHRYHTPSHYTRFSFHLTPLPRCYFNIMYLKAWSAF